MDVFDKGCVTRLPHSDMHGRYVFDAIREGLWPFKARSIQLFFEYDIDFHRYVLFAEVWFPDYQILKRVDIDAFELADDIDAAAFKMSEQMKQKFRNREILPIHDKIVLGED